MRYLYVMLLGGLLTLLPTLAFANCTNITMQGSNGQVKMCMQCCMNGQCTISCL